MIILIVAMGISGLVGVATGAALRFVLRRRVRNPKVMTALQCIVAFVTGVGLIVPVHHFIWARTIVQGTCVPIDAYRGMGPRLPSVVTQVTYYSDWARTDAVFEIEERSLMTWVSSHKWAAKEIEVGERVYFPQMNVSTSITRGVKVDERFHPRGTGVRIVFSRETGFCYFEYASY